jgi:mRNA interferase HicA
LRHGRSHDLYMNPKTGKKQPVSRHNEIDELLAKHIIKELT